MLGLRCLFVEVAQDKNQQMHAAVCALPRPSLSSGKQKRAFETQPRGNTYPRHSMYAIIWNITLSYIHEYIAYIDPPNHPLEHRLNSAGSRSRRNTEVWNWLGVSVGQVGCVFSVASLAQSFGSIGRSVVGGGGCGWPCERQGSSEMVMGTAGAIQLHDLI